MHFCCPANGIKALTVTTSKASISTNLLLEISLAHLSMLFHFVKILFFGKAAFYNNCCECVYDVVLCGQGGKSQIVTNTASSPGAQVNSHTSEPHSSQIAVDFVLPPESSKPAGAPVKDAASTPATPPAEPGERSSPQDARLDDQAEHSKTESSPEIISTAGEASQAAVSSEAKSQQSVEVKSQATAAVDKTVSDNDGKLTQPSRAAVSNEPAAEAAIDKTVPVDDDNSTQPSQVTESDKPAAEAAVKEQAPAADAASSESSQPSKSDVMTGQSADHRDQLQTSKSVDSQSGGSTDRQVQPADTAVNSADDDDDDDDVGDGVKQHLAGDKHTKEQSEHLSQAASELSASKDDSERSGADKAREESDNSADRPPASEDVGMASDRAESESELVMDDEFTAAAVDNDAGNGYLLPLINCWATADAWLITCIHSVSSKCVTLLIFMLIRFFIVLFA